MPESDLKAICRNPIYVVDDLVNYKRRWRVAASALNYRLREVGLISDSKCTSNYVEMSRRGWLKTEPRSEEHTSELQSLMRNSYAVFCLKKKKNNIKLN